MYKRIASLVLMLALTAAACGAGTSGDALATLDEPEAPGAELATLDGSDGSPSDEAPADISVDEAMLALADCLRDQGFEVQDPEIDEDGFPRINSMFHSLMESGQIDRAAVGAAMETCAEFADAITTRFRDGDTAEREDQMFAYAECMRDNGYEMADPDFSEGHVPGQGGGPFGALDRDDPDFQAAQEVCQDLFMGGGPGGGLGGRPGGGTPSG